MLSLKVGARCSTLALAQARLVERALAPYCERIDLVGVRTSGDILSDIPLTEVGGKALFLKELEEKLLTGEIDIAVHSMKDVPAFYHDDLEVVPVLKRAIPNDVFVSFRYPNMLSLPSGAVIGTCAPRRVVQLNQRFRVIPLRGNIATRVEKAKNLDGIILAFCGLERLGLCKMISEVIHEDVMLPGVAQGALCVEFRKKDHFLRELILNISDRETIICTTAERAFLEEINGDCKTALGALAVVKNNTLYFTGMLGKDNRPCYFRTSGSCLNAKQIGRSAALALLRM
ncbi:porphobilinogen deaminase [Neorickettsia risticii str. Illinois]|uniref:Hydroxymethylbilane synthase n=1 Tax=Neorickettsia risticii (strain Illinois) TaxID=434131 RepID=C6V4N6_NEORI|nr:hydroxymethylbilane synthase [Neorickettsia risticii]ACT69361.1 porphobilinogen deaminase [Neorickettsia risticii str. Illinois]